MKQFPDDGPTFISRYLTKLSRPGELAPGTYTRLCVCTHAYMLQNVQFWKMETYAEIHLSLNTAFYKRNSELLSFLCTNQSPITNEGKLAVIDW